MEKLLTVHGNRAHEAVWWKRTQGYGLRASDFDAIPDCSRRIFSQWRDFLLKLRLIKPLKSRDRGDPYTITSLGVCYLISKIDDIRPNQSNDIIKFLDWYSSYDLYSIWQETCKIITRNDALKILKKVCDAIEISQKHDRTIVVLRFKSSEKIIYESTTYTIRDNEIRLILPDSKYTVEQQNPVPTSTPLIKEELFHTDVAEFIIQSLCYSIIEDLHHKIIGITRMLGWAKLAYKKELTFRNKLSEYNDMLEKIPLDVHLMGTHFAGEKIFGRTKIEQKLAKAVSDYFYQKILPKHGYEFVDKDGNPFSIFSPDNLKL